MSQIYVISGPSGVGKTAIIEKLRKHMPNMVFIPSCTSRAPRPGEVNGQHYYFLSMEDFQRKVNNGEFIEYEIVHGNLYGTLKKPYTDAIKNGKNVIKDIDVNGALKFKKIFGEIVTTIFITPPSYEELKNRLVSRGDISGEEMGLRLHRLNYEKSTSRKFDHVVINDNLDDAVSVIRRIIASRGCRQFLLEELNFTQSIRDISFAKVEEIAQSNDPIPPIRVVKGTDGRFYVDDGHHRCLATAKNGKMAVMGKIADIDWQPFPGIEAIQYDYKDIIIKLIG